MDPSFWRQRWEKNEIGFHEGKPNPLLVKHFSELSVAKGRSMADAPEIDGAVYVASRRPMRVGEIAMVKIERADAYDLHGTAVGF